MPVLTILIPVYNHYIYLDKCLQSILGQCNETVEVVCVDDNSTDPRVLEYLDALQGSQANLVVAKNSKNLGISAILNQGVALSNGEFIGFVDCDDFLPPGAIGKALYHIQKYPDVDYFFSDRYDVDEDDNTLRRANYGGYPNIKPSEKIKSDLLDGMVASHLKVIRKSMITQVGGFDPKLNGVQDWELALKIVEKGHFFYIREPLYHHRIHTKSVTQSDKVSQFRKTNIVRRRFCTRWFKKLADPQTSIAEIKQIITEKSSITDNELSQKYIALFTPGNYSLPQLKIQTESGNVCIFDARDKFQLAWINFLREFNSYFDLIIADDPAVAVSIMGYVWDPRIIWLIDPS